MQRRSAAPSRPETPPTLADVARLAGVAKSTASRALSNPGRISEKTAARILEAAAELNYLSHGIARALSTRSTRTVGAVIPTLDNAIYAVSTHSLEQRLQKAGYMLLVASHEFDLEAEIRALEALLSRGADAIVLVGHTHRKRAFELLARANVPYVLTWNYRKGGHPCVGFDNHEAGVLIADHLIALGHRRIAMVAGITRDNDRAAARVRGVRDRLERAGLKLPEAFVLERDYSLEGGRDGVATLLSRRVRPSAIVCGNDILAIGALDELRRRRIEVPREISVTGFDDMALASVANPPLTTVHFPMAEVGANAAAYLLNALERAGGPVQQRLQVRLAVRQSSGAPHCPARGPLGF